MKWRQHKLLLLASCPLYLATRCLVLVLGSSCYPPLLLMLQQQLEFLVFKDCSAAWNCVRIT